jgi:hypothetical protein
MMQICGGQVLFNISCLYCNEITYTFNNYIIGTQGVSPIRKNNSIASTDIIISGVSTIELNAVL